MGYDLSDSDPASHLRNFRAIVFNNCISDLKHGFQSCAKSRNIRSLIQNSRPTKLKKRV